MRVSHSSAIELESIVRKVYNYANRGGMGGYIDADHFESEPFDAALIALAPLWTRATVEEVETFLIKWEHALRKDNCDNLTEQEYTKELKVLVADLMRR